MMPKPYHLLSHHKAPNSIEQRETDHRHWANYDKTNAFCHRKRVFQKRDITQPHASQLLPIPRHETPSDKSFSTSAILTFCPLVLVSQRTKYSTLVTARPLQYLNPQIKIQNRNERAHRI